jgi:16S rRNA (adenine1518-N6/adenine1519-N6)-dimethyltransferase
MQVTHLDVLKVNWPLLAAQRGGPLSLIGNLPFYITSQILFSLADSYKAVKSGVFTTQLEVDR